MIKKIKREISRRKLLKGAAGIAATTLAASALPKPAISQGLKKVKFQLAWLPTGGNAFSLMAKQLGYWEKRGLDVEVPRGFGSGAATQAVAAKQTDITLAATGTAILGVIKDLPLICTATGGYDSTMGIAVAPNSGIKSPKDLEGKKLGTVATSGEAPYVPLYFDKVGIDKSKITQVSLDAKVLEQALISGRVDAISTFAISSVPAFISNNFDAKMLLFSDVGLSFYQLSVVTRPDFLAANETLIEDFTQGLMEGIKFSLLNPEETIDRFLREVPEVAATDNGRRTAELGQSIFQVTMLADEPMKHSIGYSDLDKVNGMAEGINKAVGEAGAKVPPVESYYTNKYIGDVKLTAAEWAKVTENNLKVAKMMGKA